MHYSMSVQGIVVLGKMEAALALLIRPEADGLGSQSVENYYRSFHTLLGSGLASSGCDIGIRVHAAVDRFGLIPLAPVATADIQDSDRSYENGESGESFGILAQLWL